MITIKQQRVHDLASLWLLRKLACQIVFIFIESSKVIYEAKQGCEQLPLTTLEKLRKYF